MAGANRARMSWLKEHRTWEDWVGLGLGVLIVLSPWIATPSAGQGAPIIAVAIGFLVTLLAQLELVALRRWHEVAEVACGVALIASPVMLGYAKTGQLDIGILPSAHSLRCWSCWLCGRTGIQATRIQQLGRHLCIF